MCAQPAGSHSTFITLSQQEFATSGGNEKLAAAGRMGFCYLEIPQNCKPLINKGVEFAKTFYKDHKYTKLNLDDNSRFSAIPLYQVESLHVEDRHWKTQLPEEVVQLATQMHLLAGEVLKKILAVTCKVTDVEKQAKMSGGVSSGQGVCFLHVNHYRPDNSYEGFRAHHDFSQVSVLYADQEGLQTVNDSNWMDIPPIENHFVILFGRPLEYSANNREQLKACWHRVKHVPERISFQIEAVNALSSQVYKLVDHELVDMNKTFEESYLTLFLQY